jgi:hypothetical protein
MRVVLRGRSWAVVVILCAVALPEWMSAQGRAAIPLDSVKLGAMIRVETAEREFKGALLSRTASVIEIRPTFDIESARTPDTTWAVLRSEVREGAVRTGSRWQTGALVGSVSLGVAAGVLACLMACWDEEISSDATFVLVATGLGAVAGAVGGGISGHFVKVWAPLDGVSLGVSGRG